jgi:hypothetical protein
LLAAGALFSIPLSARSSGRRLEAPVVEDQELNATERSLSGVATIAAGEREIGEQLGAWLSRMDPPASPIVQRARNDERPGARVGRVQAPIRT